MSPGSLAFPRALDGPIAQNNLIENLPHLLKSIRPLM